MPIYSLPVETVEQFLEELGSTKDILNFALASRTCCQFALPSLYRRINWVIGLNEAVASERARAFLVSHPVLFSALRSLRLSEKKFDPESDAQLPGSWPCVREAPLITRKHPQSNDKWFNESHMMTTRIMVLLPNFVTLSELTLRSLTLPVTFFQSIHLLSGMCLRRLTVRSCRLSSRYPRGYDPSTLNLVELSLLQLLQGAKTSVGKLKAILKLARSPALQVLKIDRSIEAALDSLTQYGLPSSVHTLVLDFRGTSLRAGRRPLESLFKFLNTCDYVRNLQLTDMGKLDGFADYPQRGRLSRKALPQLTSIAAPPAYLSVFVIGRPVKNVTFVDVLVNHPPVVRHLKVCNIAESLQMFKSAKMNLEAIQFNMKDWDTEIIYMLSEMSPNVKEIKISFHSGYPDDNFFMSLGNIIEFPCLECLHLYRLGDKMARKSESSFEDHNEYVIIWQLHMPNLYEVALAPDVIWRKERNRRSGWMRTYVQAMKGVENLLSTCSD